MAVPAGLEELGRVFTSAWTERSGERASACRASSTSHSRREVCRCGTNPTLTRTAVTHRNRPRFTSHPSERRRSFRYLPRLRAGKRLRQPGLAPTRIVGSARRPSGPSRPPPGATPASLGPPRSAQPFRGEERPLAGVALLPVRSVSRAQRAPWPSTYDRPQDGPGPSIRYPSMHGRATAHTAPAHMALPEGQPASHGITALILSWEGPTSIIKSSSRSCSGRLQGSQHVPERFVQMLLSGLVLGTL